MFRPRPDQGNAVSMYVCGVTVYSMSHIGVRMRRSRLRSISELLLRGLYTRASIAFKGRPVTHVSDRAHHS